MSHTLQELLDMIDISSRPQYFIKRVFRPGREEWIAKVKIFDGNRVMSSHHGPTHRDTCGAAIADAAWEAVTSIGHTLREKLETSTFSHIPRRKPGTREYIVSPVGPYVYPQEMVRTQDIAVELSNSKLKLQEENHTLCKRLRDTESTLRAHIRMRTGEDSDIYSSNIKTWTATSPAREPHASAQNGSAPLQVSTAEDANSRAQESTLSPINECVIRTFILLCGVFVCACVCLV